MKTSKESFLQPPKSGAPDFGGHTAVNYLAAMLSDASNARDIPPISEKVAAARTAFRSHIVESKYLNIEMLLVELHDGMEEEHLLLSALQGNHQEVLGMLVSRFASIDAAINYAKRFIPSSNHQELLNMILQEIQKPKSSISWESAGRLVASLGDSLNATKLIESMPDDLDLMTSVSVIRILIRDLLHKGRHMEITKGLLSSRMMQTISEVHQSESRQIMIQESTSCTECNLRVGGKVFVIDPTVKDETTSSIVCLNCWSNRDNIS